jgi:hypothetical protein
MNNPRTILLATVIALASAGTALAEEPHCLSDHQALQLAKNDNYSLGTYTRCYQREFHDCLRENREVGTGGYQVHYMCRQTAADKCRRHEKVQKLQMHRG